MEVEQRGRLEDILTAGRLIAKYVHDTSPSQFESDTLKQDAVVRRIEIIGEATRHLTEETQAALPKVPFRQMRGMRNIVAHDYANVNIPIVWEVATVHVPRMVSILEEYFST